MVIVILGILAAVAIPKFVGLQKEANQAVCDGNLSSIRSALSGYYAKTAVSTGNAAFPGTLADTSFTANYFADGVLPTCPWATAYTYNSTSGGVTRHSH